MDFIAKDHKKEPILIEEGNYGIAVVKPIEIHHKEDGSSSNEPSFAIVSVDVFGKRTVGEISLEMLNQGLETIGYKISRI